MQMAAFKAVMSPPPTVGSVAPDTGSTSGGTVVTITGSNFATGATVTVGGTTATNVTVTNSTSMTATTPAHAAGPVNVTVTNPDAQSGTITNGFTYVSTAPIVGSVTPASGSTLGGTIVTITGSNFVSGATVTFGGAAATNVTVATSSSITATTPAHVSGAVNVIVTNPDTENGTLVSGFTYFSTAPTVASVAPNSGPMAGGTSVTITGTNFVSGATVAFGSAPATNVTVVDSTSITAATPAHVTGVVSVTVTNPDSQSGTLTNGFSYISTTAPTVGSVSPPLGTTLGGTSVTVTGTNFVPGATLSIGGTAASNVAVVNSTTLTATSPAHAAGVVNVVVTNPNTESGTLTNGFTYVSTAPTVASVTPSSGLTTGGTAVSIVGTNFVAGATVSFGGTAASNVVVLNSTTLTATTPAHAAGGVNVVVTNPDTQTGALVNGFTFGSGGGQAISFIQVAAAVPQSSPSTVTVAYPAAQTAGDLNVVIVGWNNATSLVQSVQDSAGNLYSLAIGPTTGTGLRQSIYYASNIRAGSNTVTVTFNQATAYPDVRILQYRGVTTLDVAAGASGSGDAANSGAATTTAPNALIVGASTVAYQTAGAGTGFTSRIITSPNSDIAEDRIVTTTGSYSATAPLTGNAAWVMQMAAFK
jgi:hypothetical protein